MSRRDQIELTPEEQLQLLDEERVVIATTIGPRGWPHSMPLWFTVRDGEIWAWTFAKSQKVKNLERNASIGMLVDTGTLYHQLKGVHLMGTAEILDDPAAVTALWESMRQRYRIKQENAAGASAPKRLVIKVHADKVLSWDHGKLGGGY